MPIRSIIAILLLINYLLVVGAGCVNRPEDRHELLLVQTTGEEPDGQHYQQCRYLRLDGLKTFLTEALASRYKMAAQQVPHHLFFVVSGVDAHHLPVMTWPPVAVSYQPVRLIAGYEPPVSVGVSRALYTPPWLG